jgi:phosphate/sulfate permease
MITNLFNQMGELLLVILQWLFSPASAGVLTIITGFIAWFVYRNQVKSREKEAAVILLNEIRHAESSLKVITGSGFDVQNETISILTTCSWDKNYQIFTRYLCRDDFKLLSDFFNGCKAAQSELEQWRRYFVVAREEKGKAIQVKLIELAESYTNEEDYKQRQEKIIKKTKEEDFLFPFGKPEKYFAQYVRSLPQISGTTILANLSKLAEEK